LNRAADEERKGQQGFSREDATLILVYPAAAYGFQSGAHGFAAFTQYRTHTDLKPKV